MRSEFVSTATAPARIVAGSPVLRCAAMAVLVG